jgi:hypothetical protein
VGRFANPGKIQTESSAAQAAVIERVIAVHGRAVEVVRLANPHLPAGLPAFLVAVPLARGRSGPWGVAVSSRAGLDATG